MNSEAKRSAFFAKPAIVIEDADTVDFHRFTLLLYDKKFLGDDVEF